MFFSSNITQKSFVGFRFSLHQEVLMMITYCTYCIYYDKNVRNSLKIIIKNTFYLHTSRKFSIRHFYRRDVFLENRITAHGVKKKKNMLALGLKYNKTYINMNINLYFYVHLN